MSSLLELLDVFDYFGFELVVQFLYRHVLVVVGLVGDHLLPHLVILLLFCSQVLLQGLYHLPHLVLSDFALSQLLLQCGQFHLRLLQFYHFLFVSVAFEGLLEF